MCHKVTFLCKTADNHRRWEMGIPYLPAGFRSAGTRALCVASLGPRWAQCGSDMTVCASGCREQVKLPARHHNPSRTRNRTGKLHGRTLPTPCSPQQSCIAEGMASSQVPAHLSMPLHPHGVPLAAAYVPIFLAMPNTRSVDVARAHTCCRSDDPVRIPSCCNRHILPRISAPRTQGACKHIFVGRPGPEIRGACHTHRLKGTAGICECALLNGGQSHSTDTQACSFAALGQ